MAITYSTVLRQFALKVNALVGTQSSSLEDSYNNVPLTSADFDSTIIPFTAAKDFILNAQEGLLLAIASTANHPWRELVGIDVTANIAHGGRIPSVGSVTTNQIVGVYGSIRDATDFRPLTEKSIRQIQDRVTNFNTMWLMPVYWYTIQDRRLYHTRANAVIDVCTYARPDADSLDLATNILIPDILSPAMADGATMMAFRDDEYLAQAGRAGELYGAWLMAIKAGLTSVDSRAVA